MRRAGGFALAVMATVITAVAQGQAHADDFQVSFQAGVRDAAGRSARGTEMRLLTTHDGKLYAGNGYWEDRPGPEGRHGAEILVLDAPGLPWRVDHVFEERLPKGAWRDLAVGALADARFATDGSGAPLSKLITLLLASTWNLTGAARVFARDARRARGPQSPAEDRPVPDFLP